MCVFVYACLCTVYMYVCLCTCILKPCTYICIRAGLHKINVSFKMFLNDNFYVHVYIYIYCISMQPSETEFHRQSAKLIIKDLRAEERGRSVLV